MAAEHAIAYDRPARTSDEGLPLANGLLGALVWGDGAPLTISLDRTDLWDLREIPEYQAADYRLDRVLEKHRAGLHDHLITELEEPYKRAGPTKIPAGRIELVVDDAEFGHARLPVSAPIAEVDLKLAKVRVAVHAQQQLGMIEVTGAAPGLRLVAPSFGSCPPDWVKPEGLDFSSGDVWDLAYGAPDHSAGEGWQAFVQEGYGGFRFAVALCWRTDGQQSFACWTITTSDEGDDPLALALERTQAAMAAGFDQLATGHLAWWNARSSVTSVSLPDPEIERAYALDLYKFDAAARAGAPPISLQGPWTGDNGRLPPWKGDYHHDLNTQMSYWPALPAGRFAEHLGFLDWLWETRDAGREWTRRFFQVDGLNVPMTADLLNRQIGGWRQYTHSISTGAWLAEHFVQHWRYTGDKQFLLERAYPYLAEVCTFIDAITQDKDEQGFRAPPPISSSPEIHHNHPEAWFERITNYDLALFRSALEHAKVLAVELDLPIDAARWMAMLKELPNLALDGDRLLVAPGFALHESHRHFSHLMAIHPLGLIDPWRSPRERAIATASLAALEPLGTDFWMGYSFAWLACFKARVGDGDGALAALAAYDDAFLLQNSFHANGDFANKGYSKAVFRAFTLEGNFAAAQAVHEMLLQEHGGVTRLFPALPTAWKDVSFAGLRAPGGLTVSGSVKDGRLAEAVVEASVPTRAMVAFALSDTLVPVEITTRTVLSSDQLLLLNGVNA